MTPPETPLPSAESDAPARRLRHAAVLMREQHGPDHERHEMWAAMETLLFMVADHTDGRGNTCGSCVGQAVAVADAYLNAVLPPGIREHGECGDVDCETCHPTAPLITGGLDPNIPTSVLPPAKPEAGR